MLAKLSPAPNTHHCLYQPCYVVSVMIQAKQSCDSTTVFKCFGHIYVQMAYIQLSLHLFEIFSRLHLLFKKVCYIIILISFVLWINLTEFFSLQSHMILQYSNLVLKKIIIISYFKMFKTIMLLNILLGFFSEYIETTFQIDIFQSIIHVLTVNFDQCNAFLLDKFNFLSYNYIKSTDPKHLNGSV